MSMNDCKPVFAPTVLALLAAGCFTSPATLKAADSAEINDLLADAKVYRRVS